MKTTNRRSGLFGTALLGAMLGILSLSSLQAAAINQSFGHNFGALNPEVRIPSQGFTQASNANTSPALGTKNTPLAQNYAPVNYFPDSGAVQLNQPEPVRTQPQQLMPTAVQQPATAPITFGTPTNLNAPQNTVQPVQTQTNNVAPAFIGFAPAPTPQTQNSTQNMLQARMTMEEHPSLSKRIEELYGMMQNAQIQASQGQTVDAGTQAQFGTELVKVYNRVSRALSFMIQTLTAATTTPLLNQAQQQYVTTQMIPQLDLIDETTKPIASTTKASTTAAAKAVTAAKSSAPKRTTAVRAAAKAHSPTTAKKPTSKKVVKRIVKKTTRPAAHAATPHQGT